MAVKISLYELADLSIGTPEIGIVNFNALHVLLHAILRQLKIQDIKTEIKEDRRTPPKPGEKIAVPVDKGLGDLMKEAKERGKQQDEDERGEAGDSRLDDLEKKMLRMEANLQGIEDQVRGVEDQVHGVEDQVRGMDNQVHGMEDQVRGVEDKMQGVENKVHGMEKQVRGVGNQVQGLQDKVHGVRDRMKGMGGQLKGLEKQMSDLERLPSGTDLMERTRSGTGTAVADMWQMMQMQKKIEANENGISQVCS